MTAHTPGPWAYRQDDTGEDAFVVVSDGRPYVATVHGGARDWTEHNARLIAAAPDLLAVAQHSATALRLSGVEANAHSENHIEWLLHQTEAAIAKAKGESA